jgi:hypothetical protein
LAGKLSSWNSRNEKLETKKEELSQATAVNQASSKGLIARRTKWKGWKAFPKVAWILAVKSLYPISTGHRRPMGRLQTSGRKNARRWVVVPDSTFSQRR